MLATCGCGTEAVDSGSDPALSLAEAEEQVRSTVDDTVSELGLSGGTTVIDGPESCLDPSGDEKFSYMLRFDGLEEGRPQEAVGDVRGYWDDVAMEWASDGEAEVSGDAAGSTVRFDGLEVYVQITGESDVLLIKGFTDCYS